MNFLLPASSQNHPSNSRGHPTRQGLYIFPTKPLATDPLPPPGVLKTRLKHSCVIFKLLHFIHVSKKLFMECLAPPRPVATGGYGEAKAPKNQNSPQNFTDNNVFRSVQIGMPVLCLWYFRLRPWNALRCKESADFSKFSGGGPPDIAHPKSSIGPSKF